MSTSLYNVFELRFSHRRPVYGSILHPRQKKKNSHYIKEADADIHFWFIFDICWLANYVADYFTSHKKHTGSKSRRDFRMNPVQTGKCTVAVMYWSRTLRLCQPADSHWLDNVSPSLPPSSHPSLLCTISLPCHQSRFGFHSLSCSLPLTVPPPCFYFASVSSLQARPQHYTAAAVPALFVCLCVCLPVYLPARPHQEPLPCIDWSHTDAQEMKLCAPRREIVTLNDCNCM